MHNSSQTVNGMTNKNKIIKKKFFICAPFFPATEINKNMNKIEEQKSAIQN